MVAIEAGGLDGGADADGGGLVRGAHWKTPSKIGFLRSPSEEVVQTTVQPACQKNK